MSLQHQQEDLGAILERTRNVLSNHKISANIANLAQLSLASKRLAQRADVTQDDEHTAQLFYAQRGHDISKHMTTVLTTQQLFSPQMTRTTVLDFDIQDYLETQQDSTVANIFENTLNYHTIQSRDIFSQDLGGDWSDLKNDILQDMAYNIGPNGAFDAAPNQQQLQQIQQQQQKLPLQITEPYQHFSPTQDAYAQGIRGFVTAAAQLNKDLPALRELLLTLPSTLVQISGYLADQERDAPLSTTHQQTSPSNMNHTFVANNTYAYKQHETMSELWVCLESIAQVLKAVHEQDVATTDGDLTMNTTTTTAFPTRPGTAAAAAALGPQYRYKNWFLKTKTEHTILGTLSYLQALFLDQMTQEVAADEDLLKDYNNVIQDVQDDDQLMAELVTFYCRTRDFKTRFIAQSYNNNNIYNNTMNPNTTYGANSSLLNTSLLGQGGSNLPVNVDTSRENPWCAIYCCVRAGYYQSAINLINDLQNSSPDFRQDLSASALVKVLKVYAQELDTERVKECLLDSTLWSQLYSEMNTPTPTPQQQQHMGQNVVTNYQVNQQINPFRRVVYSVLGHFPIPSQEMNGSVQPYVLLSTEDYIWYRLKLITQQDVPQPIATSYRHLASHQYHNHNMTMQAHAHNNANLLEQLALSHLQGTILSRGPEYFARQTSAVGVNANVTNPTLYVNILFLTQQYERAVVELYTINPVLGFHLALMCLFFGLIRTTSATSDLLIPVNISLHTVQQLQHINTQTTNTPQQHQHLSLSLLYQTHHTRYAINMYKLIINYIQTTQDCCPMYTIPYAYCTRFIPLFSNLHLYTDYILDNGSNGQPTPLTSIEYTTDMIFSPQIPQSILNHYQNTLLSLNSPVSHLILSYAQSEQIYEVLRRFNARRNGAGLGSTENMLTPSTAGGVLNGQQLADLRTMAALFNNTSTPTTAQQQRNAAELAGYQMGDQITFHDFNTSIFAPTSTTTPSSRSGKSQFTGVDLSTAFGVELPLMMDILLSHKAQSPLFLGPGQTLHSFRPGLLQSPQINQPPLNMGVLYNQYPDQIVNVLVAMAIDRDNDARVI